MCRLEAQAYTWNRCSSPPAFGVKGELGKLEKSQGLNAQGVGRAKGLGCSLGSQGRDMVRSVLSNYTCGCPGWYDLSEETVRRRKRAPVTGTPALSPPLGPPSISSEAEGTRWRCWLTRRCPSARPEPGSVVLAVLLTPFPPPHRASPP